MKNIKNPDTSAADSTGMYSISQSGRQSNPLRNKPPRWAAIADIFIILIVLTVTLLTFPAISAIKPVNIAIYRDNRLIATYPLSVDRVISVPGSHGTMEITIKNGSASVTRSDCPHRICMKSGSIKKPYSQIVCAPNHILITVTSTGNDTLDAIAR